MASFFKSDEKLGDSSNFATWKVRLEIVADNNDVLDYIKGKVPAPPENASKSFKKKHKKGELKQSKL